MILLIFYSHVNKTHFHSKGFALSLVLKARVFGTRKWPLLVQFRQVSRKKRCFRSWPGQGLSARLFCHLPDLLLTQSIFLNVFFPFLCHYVPLRWRSWWRENNYNYNYLLINRLFCIELSGLTRFASFLPTVLKTWTPCKYCK